MGDSKSDRKVWPWILLSSLCCLAVGLLLGGWLENVDDAGRWTDWGTAGEWAGAVFTAVLLGFTFYSWRKELRHTTAALAEARESNAREAERWEADRRDRERSQADRVGCYYGAPEGGGLTITCRNDSDALIYDVCPFAITGGREHRGPTYVVPVGSPMRLSPFGGPRISPGEEVVFVLQLPNGEPDRVLREVLIPNAYGVTFADNAGRWWRKWGDLTLEEDATARDAVGDTQVPTTPRGRAIAASQLAG